MDPVATLFVLFSAALVLLMTPGLAFFYGGFGSRNNVISILKQSFVSLGITTILWYAIGYSLCFSGDVGGVIGDFGHVFLRGIDHTTLIEGTGLPSLAFFVFQLAFAIITPALITGAFVDRVTFKAYLIFLVLWQVLVYYPFVHMVWGGGILHQMGVVDFAGGIVVHPLAGMAALACVFFVGSRKNRHDELHNRPMVALGAALLWFGWFGFNAGSALAVDSIAVLAFVNTQIAASAGAVVWMLLEWRKEGKPKLVGFLIGAISGLVAITPAAGFVSVGSAAIIGVISAIGCFYAVALKNYLGWDDALDVWGVHGVGGIIGSVSVGIFASSVINAGVSNGLIYGGGVFFLKQIMGVLIASLYSFVVTYGLLFLVDKITPVKVALEDKAQGMDSILHGEQAYTNS